MYVDCDIFKTTINATRIIISDHHCRIYPMNLPMVFDIQYSCGTFETDRTYNKKSDQKHLLHSNPLLFFFFFESSWMNRTFISKRNFRRDTFRNQDLLLPFHHRMYNGAVKLDQFAHHYIISLMSIYASNIYSTIWACMYTNIGRFRIKESKIKCFENKRLIFLIINLKIIEEVKKFLIYFKFFHRIIIILILYSF